jgi:hypothetical protein
VVVPIPIRPFESITKTFDPPLELENMATFVPRVPGPTSSPLLTNTFVVERAFGAYRLFVKTKVFKFEIVATFRVPTLAVVAKTFVVVTALEMYALPVTCKFEVGFAPVRILIPVPVIRAYSVEPPKKAWRVAVSAT